jgi:hypothetical protein
MLLIIDLFPCCVSQVNYWNSRSADTIPDTITLGRVFMYADDTTIYCVGKNCYIIDEYLNKFSLKSPSQWGFTKGLSAEGMLLSITDRWKMELDKGMTVGAIFVDFRKAFDSISHDILSLKLQAVGLCGNLHEWLMHYLKDRYQYTVVNGCTSDLYLVQYGVPQVHSLDLGCIPSTSMTSLIPSHLGECLCTRTTLQFIVWGRTSTTFARN